MVKGLHLLKGKMKNVQAFVQEMENTRGALPSEARSIEVLGLSHAESTLASATLTFLYAIFAVGEITPEGIEDILKHFGFSNEEAVSYRLIAEKLSQKTINALRARKLRISMKRILPNWQSLSYSIDFKSVSFGQTLQGLVPFVSVNLSLKTEGENKQEVSFGLDIVELIRLRNRLTSVFDTLKQETATLTEKMGDTVISMETAESIAHT
jgi:hypothetical protein